MALNKLKSFRWINGTSATDYVSLNKDEFDALIELVKRGGITKDIQGYIHPINSITSYQQYLLQLNCPNLVLVDPIVESVDYNVTLDSVEMYEGTRNKINVYLIDLAALDIRIISHTIVRDNAITDEQIRNRVSIDSQNGYIVVDSARENSTWTDNVRIEILPKYEDWESELYTPKVINVLIKANKVTGAQIQTPEVVKPGSFFYPKVVLMPADNSKQLSADPTKGIYLVPFGDNFQMTIVNNTITAYAPNNEGTYQLGCRVYAFGLDRLLSDPSDNIQVLNPYIQFTVTTDGTFSDISTANPKITLQKVDSENTPIGEPIVLTGTVSGSSLVYNYGGGNVAGDGSETYKVSIDKISMHSAHYTDTIVPNGVISNYTINYGVIEAEIGIIYDDGTKQSKEEYYTMMSFIANKTVVGVYIETDDTKFIVDTENANNTDLYKFGGYNQTISELPSFTIEEALLDFNGKLRTNQMAFGSFGVVAAMRTMQQITSTINGTHRKAFYAAGGQAKLIAINFSFIATIAKLRSYTGVSDSSSKNYASPNRIDSSNAFFNAKTNGSISIQYGLAFPCFGLEYDVNYDVVE